jgi:hypothetical protein
MKYEVGLRQIFPLGLFPLSSFILYPSAFSSIFTPFPLEEYPFFDQPLQDTPEHRGKKR